LEFERELSPFSDMKPEEIGTRAIGDTWHFWMDLKGAITNKSVEAMLGACITGENAAIRNYKAVLEDENIPEDLKGILGRQLEEIEIACENLTQIKENL
jgi:uncharacterized protein (TIGR02284 family)